MDTTIKVFHYRHVKLEGIFKIDPYVIPYYDLTMVISGELSYWANGEHLVCNSSDVLLIPPGTTRSRDFCPGEVHYISFNFYTEQRFDLPMFIPSAFTHEIRSLFKAFTPPSILYSERTAAKASHIVGYILETLIENNQKTSQNPHIESAIDYINKHISEPITLTTLASHLHLSREYLAFLFKKETGMTISSFVNERKLLLAHDLISENSSSLCNISKYLGYENYGYFSRIFKKRFGYSPTKIKKNPNTFFNNDT